jgi:hypothetical protein
VLGSKGTERDAPSCERVFRLERLAYRILGEEVHERELAGNDHSARETAACGELRRSFAGEPDAAERGAPEGLGRIGSRGRRHEPEGGMPERPNERKVVGMRRRRTINVLDRRCLTCRLRSSC